MKFKITILSLCLFALTDIAIAQQGTTQSASSETNSASGNYGLPRKKDFDQWSIGLNGGVNWFQGDLQENDDQFSSYIKNPVFGLRVGYQMTHSFQVNLRGYYTNLSGHEADVSSRLPDATNGDPVYLKPGEFETRVIQGMINMNYTAGNISFVQRNKRVHLFAEVGAGVFNFSPELTGHAFDPSQVPSFIQVASDSTLADGESFTKGIVAGSLGLKYQFGRFDVNLMATYNKTLTDVVDWVNDAKTESDNFSYFTLGVNYTLGKKQAMMEWVNPMEVVYNDMAELKDKMDIISGDKDKDGVSDMFDKDNSTAEGIKVYGDGTSVDSDGDGVPDSKDTDPFSQKGAKVDANGVETDTDGDGVPDSRDLEPNTPKGSLTNFQGIAIDKALNEKGSMSNSVGWLPPIFFDLNKAEVKSTQRDRVLIIAKILINNPNLNLNIVGNCDPTAGEEYNQKLGLKRADAVKNHLVKHYGVDAARLTTSSKGEKDPLAKSLNPMNRRVDFEIAK